MGLIVQISCIVQNITDVLGSLELRAIMNQLKNRARYQNLNYSLSVHNKNQTCPNFRAYHFRSNWSRFIFSSLFCYLQQQTVHIPFLNWFTLSNRWSLKQNRFSPEPLHPLIPTLSLVHSDSPPAPNAPPPYETELIALCGDPIWIRTLSNHCSGPCRWISIQQGVDVTSCRWYSAPQPLTKLIRIVHIFVNSYTASNPLFTYCDSSWANSRLLKIFNEHPGGILQTVLGLNPWEWLQLRLWTKIAISEMHFAYTSPPT